MLNDCWRVLSRRIDARPALPLDFHSRVSQLSLRGMGPERLPRWPARPLRRLGLHARHQRVLQTALLRRAERERHTSWLRRDGSPHAHFRLGARRPCARITLDGAKSGRSSWHVALCLRLHGRPCSYVPGRRWRLCFQLLHARYNMRLARVPVGDPYAETQRPRHPARRSRKPDRDLL